MAVLARDPKTTEKRNNCQGFSSTIQSPNL